MRKIESFSLNLLKKGNKKNFNLKTKINIFIPILFLSVGLYDVIIGGAGPAGIFASLEFIRQTKGKKDLKVLVLDMGPDVERRYCPSRELHKTCIKCPICTLQSGWGGAGTFSDGKITLTPNVGGWLAELIGNEELTKLLKEVDNYFLEFGAPREIYGDDENKFEYWDKRAKLSDLKLERNILRHMGSDMSKQVLVNMRNFISKYVEIRLGTKIEEVVVEENRVRGVKLKSGETINAKAVLLAPGRIGAQWLSSEAKRLGIKTNRNPVDLGVRVELPYEVMAQITDDLYEPKLKFFSKTFDDYIRTFCVNPRGEVISEFYEDVVTVNGHSLKNGTSGNTNFAILVSTRFTEPFNDPIAFGKSIAKLANLISNGVIVQRLSDLLQGRRSTKERINKSITEPTLKDATPGDLSFVLPHRILTDIIEMLRALDKLTPGVVSQNTLLYGVEAKFYSSRIETDKYLQTSVKGLFVAGDGAGITRGIAQAAASGMHAARSIAELLNSNVLD
ncbi:MAG: NAD(P)/FAD-dependent oxidoreductase [Thermoproteota archaeon]